MRINAISAAMLLAHLGPVAAQEIDPRLDQGILDCIAVVSATGSLAFGLQVVSRDQAFANDIYKLNPRPIASQTALTVILWEQAGCDIPYDTIRDSIDSVMDPELDRISDAAGDLEVLQTVWHDFEPRLSCLSALTDAQLERGQEILESGTGYPCGYQP